MSEASAPKRLIFNEDDLRSFLSSPTKDELLKFISGMGRSCATPQLPDYDPDNPLNSLSPGLATLVGVLEGLSAWMDEIPPLSDENVRFGNPAFKIWHQRLVERAPDMVRCILTNTEKYSSQDEDYELDLLKQCCEDGRNTTTESDSQNPSTVEDASTTKIVTEVCAYLRDAFGHPIRLDYGTGHETCFQIVLLVLFKVGVFGNPPNQGPSALRLKAACLSTWDLYLKVARSIQKDYRLEPAGSHGVWGLDDYYCLAFYFGAQQLVSVPDASPRDIHRATSDETKKYLYFSCIAFIKEIKQRAPFSETSPMLNDISNLGSWEKVASGLSRLYEGEVLGKLPVVQHLVFGKYFPATWTASQDHQPEPPTKNFRTEEAELLGGIAPTRAPWAK